MPEATWNAPETQASRDRLTACSDRACCLWVSTDLESIQPDDPNGQPEDILRDGKVYRRLSPEYYLWLKARFEKFQAAVSNASPADANALEITRRFEAVRAAAKAHYTLADLKRAKARLTASPLSSPNKPARHEPVPTPTADRPAPPPAFQYPSEGDPGFDGNLLRFAARVTEHAVGQVNAIRETALAAGWTLNDLFRTRGRFAWPYGGDYGLVCFVDPEERIGRVTAETIELVCPGGHSLHFRKAHRRASA